MRWIWAALLGFWCASGTGCTTDWACSHGRSYVVRLRLVSEALDPPGTSVTMTDEGGMPVPVGLDRASGLHTAQKSYGGCQRTDSFLGVVYRSGRPVTFPEGFRIDVDAAGRQPLHLWVPAEDFREDDSGRFVWGGTVALAPAPPTGGSSVTASAGPF